MTEPTKGVRSIDDITNAIVVVDNFLDDILTSNDAPPVGITILALAEMRGDLDRVLKFFKAEG